MRILMLPVLALVLAHAAHAGEAPDAAAKAAAWRDLAAGVNRADLPTLLRAKDQFAMFADSGPGAPAAHRAAALAAWRAVPLLQGDAARPQARALLEEGLTHCDAALTANPRDAEALALEGSLQALLLGYVPERTMELGPESKSNLSKAATLAPKDPRIRLLNAIYTLHAPEFFGGGAEPALPELEAAAALFDADAPGDSTAPAWASPRPGWAAPPKRRSGTGRPWRPTRRTAGRASC